MEILKYPSPELFKVCKEVTVFGPELLVLLEAMHETMALQRGIGLAANQVGLDLRMFVIQNSNIPMFIINPKITKRSIAPANIKEGCLSAPGEFVVLLERASWVEVEFQNEKGERKRNMFGGVLAVCVQHEIDHLDGKSHLQSKSLSKKIRAGIASRWGLKVK